jgi:hypothetical protein
VAVLANGSANGSYAAKALANIGRPGPKPEKGSKGFAQTRIALSSRSRSRRSISVASMALTYPSQIWPS